MNQDNNFKLNKSVSSFPRQRPHLLLSAVLQARYAAIDRYLLPRRALGSKCTAASAAGE